MLGIKNLGTEKRIWKKAWWTDPISMPFWVFALAAGGPILVVWFVAIIAR